MEHSHMVQRIEKLLDAIEKRIPSYMANPSDANIANGNLAVCIIDSDGYVYGRLFGTDRIRRRSSYRIAWVKASQVWITGIATGKFEKMVYTDQASAEALGIMKPDLIGWEGGQPIVLDHETTLSVGFSGLRGESDLDIVTKAIADIR
ncbi:MAG: heme-binding protein [Bacteroidota bacterium]